MPFATNLAPTILVAALFLALFVLKTNNSRLIRYSLLLIGVLVVARYLPWRINETVLPADPLTFNGAWIWALFLIEAVFLADFIKHLVMRCRTIDRKEQANEAQKRLEQQPQSEWPAVDIFIPTYNEPLEVLERSILGALAQDYPHFKVWILDDGHRDWLRDYCAEHGAAYLAREDRSHAKAGNLNNGFKNSSAPFVTVFDADFVPYKWHLRRVIGLFSNPSLGIVQTPQHFFNRDPVQQNLWVADMWPDEQRLFFDKQAPAMDAWGAMFCCGSCVTYRREAVEAIGGIPTESITEDILTTLEMLRKGYETVYLNERLSVGLAAENLEAFYVQRQRWCQGGIQTLFLKAGPLGPQLNFMRRILLFPIYWLFHIPARLVILLVPAIYFWFGLEPLANARAEEILFWQVPVLAAGWMSSIWYNGRQAYPIINDGPAALVSVRLFPVVVSSLIRPFGRPFQVTPKGRLTERGGISAIDVSVLAIILALNVIGFFINIPVDTRIVEQDGLIAVAGFWATYNSAVLTIALLMSFESSTRRIQERFPVHIEATICANQRQYPCTVTDMSLGGANLETPFFDELQTGVDCILDIKEIADIEATVVRKWNGEIGLRFSSDLPVNDRRELIEYLYTTGIDNAAQVAEPGKLVAALFKRLLGSKR